MIAQATNATDAHERLARLRDEIEELDRELTHLLARRCGLARTAGSLKRALGVPIVDYAREAAVLRRALVEGVQAGLHEDAVRTIYGGIIELSRRAQLEAD